MKSADRDRIRQKQDQLLDKAIANRISLSLQITPEFAGAPTLLDLQTHIYPDWERAIDWALAHLTP